MIKEKCHVLDFPRLSCKYVYSACFIHELEKKENKKSLSGNKVCLEEEEKVLLPNPIVLSQIFPRDCIVLETDECHRS